MRPDGDPASTARQKLELQLDKSLNGSGKALERVVRNDSDARCVSFATLYPTHMLRRLALALSLALAPVALHAQELGIPVGTTAPAVALQTLDGKPVNLSQYLGKGPVLIEFWASWCANCKQLEPKLQAAAKKYAGKVTFVAVAVSVNQSVERAKRYQAQHKLPVTMLYDRSGDVSEAYETPATSYVVVVNKAGKVVYTGAGGDQDLDAAIKKAL